MAGEFELIQRFFRDATANRADVLLGVGDDCALLQVPAGQALAVSSDTLLAGHHFAPDAEPEALGHKVLAVNLSDLAAMGAEPAWVSLCISLPNADESWLSGFMRGFTQLASRFGVQLVGGDTTRGPLSIGVTVQGFVDPDRALRRDAARAGDGVYVSGMLGDAGLALKCRQGLYVGKGDMAHLDERLDRPQPRVDLGMRLQPFSRCAIDISDGLGADLGHICEQSGVGATLQLDSLPLSSAVQAYITETGDWSLPLSAGDDYELVFTVAQQRQLDFELILGTLDVAVTRVGTIEQGDRPRAIAPDGRVIDEVTRGYDHFRS